MNNRIKELAERSEIKEIGYYFFDIEEFAESIVKKCIDIAYRNNNSGEGGVIANTIKEYFGVEK
jgi:hypothetical protein